MKFKIFDSSQKKRWQKNFLISNPIIKGNFKTKISKYTEEFQDLKKMKIELNCSKKDYRNLKKEMPLYFLKLEH